MSKLQYSLLILLLSIIPFFYMLNNYVLSKETATQPSFKFEISMKDCINRSKSPIMITLSFKNESEEPKKFCTYMFYESLLKLDIRDNKGKKINFTPKLLQAGSISDKDLITILPGRVFKKSFSLNKKFIETTKSKIKPGNYIIKIIYDGCSKFDPNLPNDHLESNVVHLLVTE